MRYALFKVGFDFLKDWEASLKGGRLVFAIALGEIVQELNGIVASFFKERKYTVIVQGSKYEVVVLHPDTEDGGFGVECPALAGCASQGDSVEEALEMIKDAIGGHLEVLEEDKSLSNSHSPGR